MRILVLFKGILQLHLSLRKTCLLDPMEVKVWDSTEFYRSLSFHHFMHDLQGRVCYRHQEHFQHFSISHLQKPFCRDSPMGWSSCCSNQKIQTPNITKKNRTTLPSLSKRTCQKNSEIPDRVKKGIFLSDNSHLTFLCSWWKPGGIQDTQNSKLISGAFLGCNRTSLRFKTDHLDWIPKFRWQNFTSLGLIKDGKYCIKQQKNPTNQPSKTKRKPQQNPKKQHNKFLCFLRTRNNACFFNSTRTTGSKPKYTPASQI